MISETRLDSENMIVDELDWQKRGMQQTASGYGSKLTTRYKISYNGKLRRVYCCQLSNNGTLYIEDINKNWIVID